MHDSFTAGAQRALSRAQQRCSQLGCDQVGTADLLAALTDEPESRAAELLVQFGLSLTGARAALQAVEFHQEADEPLAEAPALLPSATLRLVLSTASRMARLHDRSRQAGTEHLLAALLADDPDLAALLHRSGLDLAGITASLTHQTQANEPEIALVGDRFELDLTVPADAVDLTRILDAAANRAGEGLRVVEDYARFVLDDPLITRRLKDVRHRFGQAVRGLDIEARAHARDTRGDVGTHITTPTEQVRENPRAVLAANFSRVAEALRSLEEYSKLIDVWLSSQFEILRYDTYTLEKVVLTAVGAQSSLDPARLYLVVGGQPTLGDLAWVVGEALAGGVQVVQLREKHLPDRELLSRAREVRILTAQARALFIMNDRPDLARLAGADGVHLGQDDLAVRDARRVLGPRGLIGVSTHDVSQLEKAILDGAGYLGVGPVFSSQTKQFDDLAGLPFVEAAAELARQPWFAIGGITEENVEKVLLAGAQRIAVSRAITGADKPRAAAAALREKLVPFWSGPASP